MSPILSHRTHWWSSDPGDCHALALCGTLCSSAALPKKNSLDSTARGQDFEAADLCRKHVIFASPMFQVFKYFPALRAGVVAFVTCSNKCSCMFQRDSDWWLKKCHVLSIPACTKKIILNQRSLIFFSGGESLASTSGWLVVSCVFLFDFLSGMILLID